MLHISMWPSYYEIIHLEIIRISWRRGVDFCHNFNSCMPNLLIAEKLERFLNRSCKSVQSRPFYMAMLNSEQHCTFSVHMYSCLYSILLSKVIQEKI